MPGTLAPVRHYQLYRDAVHQGELDPGLAQIKQVDPDAKVVWHGFPTELPSNYDRLVARAQAHGLESGAAYGLDSKGTSAQVKGDAVGDVAARSNCCVMLVDCESYWDTAQNRKTEMVTLGQRTRAKAPNALIIAQPWPVALMHSGFPYEEENDFVDANAPQYYFNDWIKPLGKERVAHLTPEFDHNWDVLNAGRLVNRVRPMLWTIQAEGWDDIIWDLITVLLAHPGIIVWCDRGLPRSRAWWIALQAIAELAKRGFTGPHAVWDFQAANKLALGIPVTATPGQGGWDGNAGSRTLSLLGITWVVPSAH